MTRQEFIENVEEFDDLILFCCDYGCGYCDDVYSDYAKNDSINEDLRYMAENADDWLSLLRELQAIPTGYDWYYKNDWGEWEVLDYDDFERFKEDVLEWADNAGDVWDDSDEEDDEEEAPIGEDDDDFVVAEEPISVGELMSVCSSQLQRIGDDKQAEEAADDEAFDAFVAGCVTIVEVD